MSNFNLSAGSIKRPIPTILACLVAAILGISAFLGLGIDQSPNIDVPAVSVTVIQPGAGPVELETEVTKKVEDAIAALGNIDQMTSTVTDGRSFTLVNFVLGTDANQATNDVRNAISQIRSSLPASVDEPLVDRVEFSGGAIMTYAVSGQGKSIEELSDLVDRTIARELLSVSGVAQVERLGGVSRAIRIDLDPGRLTAYGITATQVNDQVRSLNANFPGGQADLGGSQQTIRTLGSARTLSQLQNYRITLSNGSTVPLASLGRVSDSITEPKEAAFLNGEPAVAFSVLRSTGSTLVTVEESVTKAVAELQKRLPNIQFDLIFSDADPIRLTYQSTVEELISSCILTTIVVGIFLRNVRYTLIAGAALPLSIIPTFAVMQLLGYTLNGMTLLGLALAIGNLIDDAVCVVEDVDRHLNMGKSPRQAALDASSELGFSLLATAGTLIGVFLPVAFMGGIPGQFFQPFGVTVAVSTVFSTTVACTVTPMMSAYLLKPKTERAKLAEEQSTTDQPGPYRRMLIWALRHRVATLGIAIAFFIASLQLLPFIPTGLFSSGDTGLSTVSIDMPPGTPLAETVDVMGRANNLLKANPAVDRILFAAEKNTQATGYVNLKPEDQRNVTQREFEQQMREQFKAIAGARVTFQSLQSRGGTSRDLRIVLKSENPELLTQTANNLERQMRGLTGLVEVSSSASLVKPEIAIIPDIQRATDLGVSVQSISRTATLATIGDNESSLAKFNLSDRQIPIWVKVAPQFRTNVETLENLRVPRRDGTLIPLASVADIRLVSGPAQINRYNRARQVTIDANLQGISLGTALEQVRALPAMNPLPAGVAEEPAGDAKIMRDIFGRFLSALGLGVLSIYGVLVLLYNSFLYPIGILAALPLATGGTFLGLLIMQKELGLFALIGIVLLMGLVTKNAILLVDFALEAERQGLPQSKAVIESGVARLRPILMTSVSTVVGLLPLALGLGAGAEERSPMAVAVIGGFTTSTLLTLLVVPVLFTYVDNLQHWFKQLVGLEPRRRRQPIARRSLRAID
ncbi:MAG: efflux RND transporter permease subunit [Oscillatoriales cyanobacterium]|nr:MAG: efflux RND transporter permease subunit [Oscillatoriales cyanobacterium]